MTTLKYIKKWREIKEKKDSYEACYIVRLLMLVKSVSLRGLDLSLTSQVLLTARKQLNTERQLRKGSCVCAKPIDPSFVICTTLRDVYPADSYITITVIYCYDIDFDS